MVECRCCNLSEISSALLMCTLMNHARTGSAGLEKSFKNVRYNTINDENKYRSKDHLFMFKTTIMVNKREKILYNSEKRLSSFFISLTLTLSFYLYLLFSLPFSF